MRRWRCPLGEPAFPITIVGHGRIWHRYFPDSGRLVDAIGPPPEEWGLLLVLDRRGRKWTLYSPDPEYTAMFSQVAHTLKLEVSVFAEKFSGWNSGWRVD